MNGRALSQCRADSFDNGSAGLSCPPGGPPGSCHATHAKSSSETSWSWKAKLRKSPTKTYRAALSPPQSTSCHGRGSTRPPPCRGTCWLWLVVSAEQGRHSLRWGNGGPGFVDTVSTTTVTKRNRVSPGILRNKDASLWRQTPDQIFAFDEGERNPNQ